VSNAGASRVVSFWSGRGVAQHRHEDRCKTLANTSAKLKRTPLLTREAREFDARRDHQLCDDPKVLKLIILICPTPRKDEHRRSDRGTNSVRPAGSHVGDVAAYRALRNGRN
jgi:hypothetical protein